MADFFAAKVTVSTTAVKAVESSSTDREFIFNPSGTQVTAGLDSSVTVGNGYRIGADANAPKRFAIPAREELWLISTTETSVDFLVTSIGR